MLSYPRVAGLALPFSLVAVGLLAFMQLTQPTCPVEPTAPEKRIAAAPTTTSSPSKPSETRDAFEKIYRDADWGANTSGVGNSGTGSTLEATYVYRRYLALFMQHYGIKSVVDAGCGDWEFSQKIDWTGIDYKGYDIVAKVIESDKAQFTKPNIQFFVGNIVEDDLPAADLLISKHVLQHLPNADVQKFLDKQLKKYKHVLLTDGVHPVLLSGDNADIKPGEYRMLDPTRPPFNVKGVKELTYWANGHMHQVLHINNTASP